MRACPSARKLGGSGITTPEAGPLACDFLRRADGNYITACVAAFRARVHVPRANVLGITDSGWLTSGAT
jgi:hypothetical protein